MVDESRIIRMELLPYGVDKLGEFQEEWGPYSWREKHPHLYGLLDSVEEVGFLPLTSVDEVQYLEEFGYAQRRPEGKILEEVE